MTNPDLAAKDVADRIRAGRNFLITSHRNPDGDALGSGLALQRLIRQLGKEARMQVRDGFNASLYNIPGANEVAVIDTLPFDYPKGYDAVFTMECPEVERTGYPVLPGPVVNIDHHLGNRNTVCRGECGADPADNVSVVVASLDPAHDGDGIALLPRPAGERVGERDHLQRRVVGHNRLLAGLEHEQ